MVLAEAVDLDVLDEHHLGVVLLEDGARGDALGVEAVAVGQELERLRDALGRLEQPLALGVLADELELALGERRQLVGRACVVDVLALVSRGSGLFGELAGTAGLASGGAATPGRPSGSGSYSPRYTTDVVGGLAEDDLVERPPPWIWSASCSQMATARVSVEVFLPSRKGTSRLRFRVVQRLYDTLWMTALRSARSTTKPVSGSGSPATVTSSS